MGAVSDNLLLAVVPIRRAHVPVAPTEPDKSTSLQQSRTQIVCNRARRRSSRARFGTPLPCASLGALCFTRWLCSVVLAFGHGARPRATGLGI